MLLAMYEYLSKFQIFMHRGDGSKRAVHIQAKQRNWELHNLYSSPNIISTTKARRMRGAGQVCMEKAMHTLFQ